MTEWVIWPGQHRMNGSFSKSIDNIRKKREPLLATSIATLQCTTKLPVATLQCSARQHILYVSKVVCPGFKSVCPGFMSFPEILYWVSYRQNVNSDDLLTIKSISRVTWSLQKQWVISKFYVSMTDNKPDPWIDVIMALYQQFIDTDYSTLPNLHPSSIQLPPYP